MPRTPFIVSLVIYGLLGFAQMGVAQTATRPTIQNVKLDERARVLIISGTGFGSAPMVTVDGQPAGVLPGGTDTQLIVTAPVAVLSTPGTYRLTLMDTLRQVGDGFVVASRGTSTGPIVEAAAGSSAAASEAATPLTAGPAGSAVVQPLSGVAPLTVIEDSGSPYRTAIGYQALSNNTSGAHNTASGWNSLNANTTGFSNTASGRSSLSFNTTGGANTASGAFALQNITTSSANTALGYAAGYAATTGTFNLFLGADVRGTSADTNTIRIGLPYTGTQGQNKTFIAGIQGTELTASAVPVFIDANGQLGILTAAGGGGGIVPPPSAASLAQQQQLRDLQQQVREQQTTNAELRARLTKLEALLAPGAVRK